MIYLLTVIGLSPGASTHLHTNNASRKTNNKWTTQITTNVEECGPCPVFASFTPAFALQLRKKQGKTSVRIRKTSVRLRRTSVRVRNLRHICCSSKRVISLICCFCMYSVKLISQEQFTLPISCNTLGSLSMSGTEHMWVGNELSLSKWTNCPLARAGKYFSIMEISSRNPRGVPRATVCQTVLKRIWTWSNCNFPTSPITSTVKETTWVADGLTTRDTHLCSLSSEIRRRKRKR